MHHTSGTADLAGTWIGRPIKRREDLRFLQGRARFVDDIVLPAMAHLVIVRSPHAHARVRGVRADDARRAPGVIAVVAARDLTGLQPMPVNPLTEAQVAQVPHPILAGLRDLLARDGFENVAGAVGVEVR